jgi:uncharacterized delta-60 repeat protein
MKPTPNSSVLRRCILETLESRQMFAFAAGTLDPSFGTGGKFTLRFGQDEAAPRVLIAEDVAVQPDGKTVVAGTFRREDFEGASDFAVARLNFDGTLDTTFGPKEHPGLAITHLSKDGGDDQVSSIAIQPDGKILVAGSARRDKSLAEDPLNMAVARFLPNGELDKSFDGDGKRVIKIDSSQTRDIVLQKNGKIVLVGAHFQGVLDDFDRDFAVVRLNPDGSADKSFSSDGSTTIGFGEDDEANGVAIDASGRIVVVGTSGPFERGRIAITHLNSDGSKVKTFGKSGTLLTDIARFQNADAQDVLIQNGKIVVLAEVDVDQDPKFAQRQFALLRYNGDGTLDASFGDTGQGFVETGLGGNENPGEILESPLGGLIAAGSSSGKVALVKYTREGALDKTFGNGGKVITDVGADKIAFRGGVAYGPGRRIVVASGKLFNTARYLDTGANTVGFTSGINSAIENPAPVPGTASFTLTRAETLPVPTRVFLKIGGTAQLASALAAGDYSLNKVQFLGGSKGKPAGAGALVPGGLTTGTLASGTAFVDIPANQKSVIVTLTANDDSKFEAVETATFTLLPGARYEVTGATTKTIEIEDNDDIRINFQAPGQAVEGGYRADVGLKFQDQGDGLRYGWDADNRDNMRIRNNKGSPDFRFDSLALMQEGGNRKWEIALPNGMYRVHLVAGDPNFTDSVYKINLENRFAISGTPSGNVRWFERTMNIVVTDGRLTLANNAGGVNNKIAFMEIKATGSTAKEGPVTANAPISLVAPPIIPKEPVTPGGPGRIFSQVLI